MAAPITSNLVIEQTRYSSPWIFEAEIWGRPRPPFIPALRDRRRRYRRDVADIRRARELGQIEGGNDRLVTLGGRRLTRQGDR